MPVDRRLVGAGQRQVVFFAEQGVLVQLESQPLRAAAHGDVVRLVAGEVEPGAGEGLVGDDAQVGRGARASRTLHLVGPRPVTSSTPGAPAKASITLSASSAVTSRSMSLEVSSARRTEPPTSARTTPGTARTRLSSRSASASTNGRRKRPARVRSRSIPRRIFSSDFAPKPGSSRSRSSLAACSSSSRVSMPSATWIARAFLAPSPGMRSHSRRPGGILLLQRVEVGQLSGRDQRGDLLGQRPADPADRGQLVALDELRQVPVEAAHQARGVVVGPGLERVLPEQLEQQPDLFQDLGDRLAVHQRSTE